MLKNIDISDSCILFADDDIHCSRMFEELLDPEGYDLSMASDGEKALELAVAFSKELDLILLDVGMPGMNGYQVCKTLKENPLTCEIPIIFLTGRTDVDDIDYGYELGAFAYLEKPLHVKKTKMTIKNALIQSRLCRLLQKNKQ